jgi:hypothetical protein
LQRRRALHARVTIASAPIEFVSHNKRLIISTITYLPHFVNPHFQLTSVTNTSVSRFMVINHPIISKSNAHPQLTTRNQAGMSLNYVRFDVGHYLHVCHRNTIEKYPNSSLVNYIKPEFDTRKSESDYIVIDRDGKHFGTILNFMRDSRSLHLNDWTRDDITDLMTEADYYCLTELVELCDQQLNELDQRDRQTRESNDPNDVRIPKNRKVEMIFDVNLMRELLKSSQKRVIIASFRSIRRYHIESWLEKLVKFCDFTKVDFYCLADRENEPLLCDTSYKYKSSDFILALYDPDKRNFISVVLAPTDEKFRTKRYRYKTKMLTFCFVAHSEDFNDLMRN